MTFIEFIACAVLVLMAGFMSTAEIALFSLSRFQLRELRDRFRPIHRKIKKLLSDPSGLLATILVVNEMLNIAISTIITQALSRYPEVVTPFSESIAPQWAQQAIIGTLIAAPVILFFCEITPKVIAARANQLMAALTAGPLLAIYTAFIPIRTVLTRTASVVLWGLGQKTGGILGQEGHPSVLREEDFMVMVEQGRKEGAIDQSELDLIKNVFELDNTLVKEVYTPLQRVFTLTETTPVRAATAALREQRNLRIPVISAGRRQITGVLYAKDLLRAKLDPTLGSVPIGELTHKPLTVPPTMRLNALFRRFKQLKTHVAIVTGDHGESLGVITMDDVLDVLFEELLQHKPAAAAKGVSAK